MGHDGEVAAAVDSEGAVGRVRGQVAESEVLLHCGGMSFGVCGVEEDGRWSLESPGGRMTC